MPASRLTQPQTYHTFTGLGRTWLARSTRAKLAVCHAVQTSRVLLIGGGGREHALAWKLAQSPACEKVFCTPGNPGIAQEDRVQLVADLNINDHSNVSQFCKQNDVDLVFVGPEAPLVDGLIDSLEAAGVQSFGPTQAAARLEGSKVFMKEVCKKYGIPSAAYETFTDAAAAKAYAESCGAPIVVKTSGLAAGKGVIVAETLDDAYRAIDDMLLNKQFGDAGDEIVVEEFLSGEEASFFALIDGSDVLALASAQDHKRAYEGDVGPNTGGMGAYTPAPVVTPEIEKQVMKDIVQATADAMVKEGAPYRGVLFAGLMINDGAAKLLEHNVRFGDPECQGMLMRLETDLLDALLKASRGELNKVALKWSNQAAVTVVYAAKGYPGSYEKGSVIHGLQDVSDAKVFHAGTSLNDDGNIVSSGGRVLSITALGRDIVEARSKAYEAIEAIDWKDGYYRSDIGWRAVDRTAGSMAASSA